MYHITDRPLRCALNPEMPMSFHHLPPEWRDPSLQQQAPDPEPPAHLFRAGSGDAAVAARQVQRQERARALEQMYPVAPAVFDRMFLNLLKDDAGLLEELRGRAYGRAAVLVYGKEQP